MAFDVASVIGHYRIISSLGAGGMGEVYLAQDTRLDRKVAVKFLNQEFSRDNDKLRRFIQEAKAASALNHPNILTVYEIGEADEKKYIVTEFVEGKTLSAQMSDIEFHHLKPILKIATQIAEALSAAHEAGIIHRDIKPDNVMIRKDGYVKVLDFGLAKLTEKRKSDTASSEIATKALVQTNPGVVMGTVNYMSPEQARGKETDERTDIWSLGIVLYEILSGRLPFAGETISHTIVAILEKEPAPLKDVPDELQRIVRKALTKDREMRYQTMKDLLIDLKNLRRTLDLQGELERSGFTNRETNADFQQENPTQAYSEKTLHEIKQSRTSIDDSGVRRNVLLFCLAAFAISATAAAAWWYFAGRTTDTATPGKSFGKTVEAAGWSSGPNEVIVEASFSPDAKMIAFSSGQSGANEIWTKPAAAGEPIQVTSNGYYNQYPIWSPNGQEVAYFSNRGDKLGIWRTSFTGGEQVQIAGNLTTSAKPRLWSKSGKIYVQQQSDIFSVDEKSGEMERVTDFESRGIQPRTIEISADESKVALAVKEGEVYKVKIKKLDSDQIDEVGVSKSQIDFLAWHPNGKDLIFSATVEGTYQIFKTSVGGGEPIQLSNGSTDLFVEDVSSDGSRILYWSQNENSDLWMIDTQNLRQSLLADSTAAEYWAAFSPDGKTVAYQAVSKVNRPFSGSVSIADAAGEKKTSVIAANGFAPAWSKSGEWVTFFKRVNNEIEIWRADRNGGDEKKIAAGGIQPTGYSSTPYLKIGINQLTFPANTDAVAYGAKRNGVSNIWLVSPDGQSDEQITTNEDQAETFCCPVWTADGQHFVVSSVHLSSDKDQLNSHRLWLYKSDKSEKKIIFESDDEIRLLGIENAGKNAVIAVSPKNKANKTIPESVFIYAIALETGASAKVNTLTDAYFQNIHLSPDGKSIAYVFQRDKLTEIRLTPLKGGTPRRLFAENDPKMFISSLAISPDGQAIVFGRQSQNSLLSMLIE